MLGVVEDHPYGIFVPPRASKMIIGTFPIGKFTNPKRRHEIKEHEFDFYYGGEMNHLWKVLALTFNTELSNKEQIVSFLEKEKIAMADVIESCQREDGRADDSKLKNIKWNTELHQSIIQNKIKSLYFTSKQVEKWFHRHIGSVEGVKETVLVSPSGSGLRSIGRNQDFKDWQAQKPGRTATEYRIYAYKRDFFGTV